MGYRKGYFRKDGTYVQGHFYSGSKRKGIPKNKNDKGCASLIFLFIILIALIFQFN